jgi:CPA2 family monovalent cation:H+ antiporter-2
MIPQKLQRKLSSIPAKIKDVSNGHSNLKNHLLIIGYGINGKNVARAAQYSDIPYIILELNADTVKQESANGEHIIYGDATQTHILESVNLNKARVVVVAISDPNATKQIVTIIRLMSQSIYIIVRTRYLSEIRELSAIGADEVIPEEFETSITIFSRVLHNLLVPLDEIEELVHSIKEDNYKFLYFNSLKDMDKQKHYLKSKKPTKITDFKLSSIRLKTDSGEIVGNSIADAHIRKTFGINILAISRNDNLIYPVLPDEKLHQNDLLYVSGDMEQINNFYKLVN